MGGQAVFSLEKDLEARYGAAFARGVCDALAHARENEGKCKDFNEMRVMLTRGRGRVRTALRALRTWKIEYALAGEGAVRRHLAAEGVALGRSLKDMIAVYRAISKDYHAMRRGIPGRLSRAESPSGCAAARVIMKDRQG